jgi:tRNA-2-methylthio-N6-dimethylallyladenosine synthase
VISEAQGLVERGVKEITLLGQNVNAYHGAAEGGTWGLAKLIRQLAKVDGLERIRFTTSHPNDMEDDLIAAHGDCEKLMPYLHLPVQSGSDRILKAMNRKHTAEQYIRLMERMRDARPDMALSGDFIVGFPGETDQDFEDTMSLVREVGYASAYSFKYSPRPGTPAAERDDKMVDPDVALERLHRLQALITEQQRAFQDGMIGREVSVLFEKKGRIEGQMVGKSEYLHAVHAAVEGVEIGDIRKLRITQSKTNSLEGVLI